MYLALDDREDLPEKVLTEMKLTRKWVLAIVGDKWPLQHRAHPLPVRGRALAHPGARPQVAAQEGGQGGAQPRQEGGLHLPHPVHRLGRRGRPAEHGLIVRLTAWMNERGGSVPISGASLPARVVRP